jgi:NosR/NirI family nitrous oxide reductase transcriptional regulator
MGTNYTRYNRRRLEAQVNNINRIALLAVLLAAGGALVAHAAAGGQSAIDPKQQALLKRLFPAATAFSPKGGDPPHFKAFSTDPRSGQTLLGLAFWTTELEPFERAYDGPIKILVGMDTKGLLTGVIVTEHHEPYGDFSVDRPEFAAQFRGKNIRDAFKVGVDIDAVSRATISVTSASRAVRNSARRVARQLLAPPEAGK